MSHGEGPPGPNAGDAVLDIGGDVGAVILYADAVYAEAEVEISPIGSDATRTHTAIHERLVDGRRVFAGLFPGLRAGEYRLWTDDAGLPDRVTVAGGEVSVVDWRKG